MADGTNSVHGRATVHCSMIYGCKAVPVDVETSVSPGLPGIRVVGLPDAVALESAVRASTAIRSSGFSVPSANILVNLAPSSLPKFGTGFDLAIAASVLAATDQVDPTSLEGKVLVGELALDGRVRPVRGMLAHAMLAQASGSTLVCSHDAAELAGFADLNTLGIVSLSDLRTGGFAPIIGESPSPVPAAPDFADIPGHARAKRALAIAVAGGHHALLVGPPGSGKSMLAARVASIMPDMNTEEKNQVATLHSIAGLDPRPASSGLHPFRAPHHSVTAAGLVGGGRPIVPGEVTLAHSGVLFLDDVNEFAPSTLQMLRQPLEEGEVRITRADGAYSFPARFLLVAASNPCPCGRFGDPRGGCTCSASQVEAYRTRIAGPLADKIDLRVDLVPNTPGMAADDSTSSTDLKALVESAREYAQWRRSNGDDEATLQGVLAACRLLENHERFMESFAREHSLDGRSIVRMLRVTRTLADMNQRPTVVCDDLIEAFSYLNRP